MVSLSLLLYHGTRLTLRLGKYVGSRPITIKKATTEVRAVEIGEKKARKLETEAKARAKSGVQKSGKGLGSAANYKGLGPSACESDSVIVYLTYELIGNSQISDVRYLYLCWANGELLCADQRMLHRFCFFE